MKRFIVIAALFAALSTAAWAQDAAGQAAGPTLSDSSTSASAAPATGVDEKTTAALQTTKDKYGIPVGLYEIDVELSSYRSTIKTTENNSVLFGVISGVLVGGGVALAIGAPDLVWAPYGMTTSVPYGYFVAAVGVGIGGYDLIGVVPGISKNKRALVRVYTEKYPQ